MKAIAHAALLACLAACISPGGPSGPPQEVAGAIVAAFDAGDTAKASELFASIDGNAEYLDKVYPVLFDAAGSRFARGDGAGAVDILSEMALYYPSATSVREALAYALFLERGARETADPERVELLDTTLSGMRAGGSTSAWLDLIETQLRIDQNDLGAARIAFDRFLQGWDGTPDGMWVYVEDLDRYLASH